MESRVGMDISRHPKKGLYRQGLVECTTETTMTFEGNPRHVWNYYGHLLLYEVQALPFTDINTCDNCENFPRKLCSSDLFIYCYYNVLHDVNIETIMELC